MTGGAFLLKPPDSETQSGSRVASALPVEVFSYPGGGQGPPSCEEVATEVSLLVRFLIQGVEDRASCAFVPSLLDVLFLTEMKNSR